MKLFSVLKDNSRRNDNVSIDHLSNNLVRRSIENLCEKYLGSASDVLVFEALPNAINETIEVLSSRTFQDKYEFEQISETCFKIKFKELDLLG